MVEWLVNKETQSFCPVGLWKAQKLGCVKKISLKADIWTWDLMNAKQEGFLVDGDVR